MGSRLARPGAAVVLEDRPKSYAGGARRLLRRIRRSFEPSGTIAPASSERPSAWPFASARGRILRSRTRGRLDVRPGRIRRSFEPCGTIARFSPRAVGRSAPLSFRPEIVPLYWNYLPIGLRKTFGFRGRTKSDNFVGSSASLRAGVEAGRRRARPGVEAAGVEAAQRSEQTKLGGQTPMPERRHRRRGGGDRGARRSGA